MKTDEVLYSRNDQVWKISDFGIASEGNSKSLKTTQYRRETSCYQAPEVLFRGVFSNKSDIWAVGCILYKLMLGRSAFPSEVAVGGYLEAGVLDIPIDVGTLPDERRRLFVSKIILEMLDRQPQMRPRAEELYMKFISWGAESSDPLPPGGRRSDNVVGQGGTTLPSL
jgi:serine/threonine protein kinase